MPQHATTKKNKLKQNRMLACVGFIWPKKPFELNLTLEKKAKNQFFYPLGKQH
jgi:hypothetical protein